MKYVYNPLLDKKLQMVERKRPYNAIVAQDTVDYTWAENENGKTISQGASAYAVIQAAIDSFSVGSLKIKEGYYKLSDPIVTKNNGQNIIGDGSSTVLWAEPSNNDAAFKINHHSCAIENVYIQNDPLSTACAIKITDAVSPVVKNTQVYGCYDGIIISGATYEAIIARSFLTAISNNGIYHNGTGSDIRVSDVYLEGMGAASRGVWLDTIEGAWFSNLVTYGHQFGCILAPGAGQTCRHIFMTNCNFDTATYSNFWAHTALGGKIYALYATNCMFSVNEDDTSSPLYLNGLTDAKFTNCSYIYGRRTGAWIANTIDTAFQNCSFANNNRSNLASSAHLTHDGTSDNLVVSGCQFVRGDQYDAGAGIIAVARDIWLYTVPTKYAIIGNPFDGLASVNVGVWLSAAGSSSISHGNAGYNPQAMFTQAVGASPWVYTNSTGYILNIYLDGALTGTEIIRAGVTLAVLAGTSRTIILYPGDQLRIYHAGAPTMQVQPM